MTQEQAQKKIEELKNELQSLPDMSMDSIPEIMRSKITAKRRFYIQEEILDIYLSLGMGRNDYNNQINQINNEFFSFIRNASKIFNSLTQAIHRKSNSSNISKSIKTKTAGKLGGRGGRGGHGGKGYLPK
jgi:hypothetical protein